MSMSLLTLKYIVLPPSEPDRRKNTCIFVTLSQTGNITDSDSVCTILGDNNVLLCAFVFTSHFLSTSYKPSSVIPIFSGYVFKICFRLALAVGVDDNVII